MYLYEATESTYQQDRYRFWSENAHVLHNYTLQTEHGTTHYGRGYETWVQCKNAARRELRKFDRLGVGAAAYYTMSVERVEVAS